MGFLRSVKAISAAVGAAGVIAAASPASAGVAWSGVWGLPGQSQNFGFWNGHPFGWGLEGQSSSVGLFNGHPVYDWGGYNLGLGGQAFSPVQNVGLAFPPDLGLPGTQWGPIDFGLNGVQSVGLPFPNGPWWGFAGQLAPMYRPYPVMVPYPVQVPAMQQGVNAQPVRCMIKQVPALTKSVEDCEKAGGDTPSAKSLQEAKK